MRAGAALVGLSAALAACGSDETSLLVAIDSDLSVPDEVDAIRLQATSPNESSDVTWDLSAPFPHTIRLIAGKDEDAVVELTATGLHDGRGVASTRETAQFVRGEEERVTIFLGPCSASCADGGPDAGDGDADADGDGDADADADADGDGDGDADGDADVWRPSNLPAELLPVPPEVEDVTFLVDTTWNTDDGQILGGDGGTVRAAGEGVIDGIAFSIQPQVDGPSVGVWSFGRLEIGAGATVAFSGAAAAAWIAADEIVVAGVVAAGAVGPLGGPAGGVGATADGAGEASGAGAGGSGANGADDPGGGGGGFGSVGGNGGAGNGAAGTGGVAYGTVELVPLLGGSGGGGGGGLASNARGAGGGGGGALQVFSRVRIVVDLGGAMEAGGAGGEPGPLNLASFSAGGGSGGGSGGGLLLEAPIVEIAGVVAANGGGGGAGPHGDAGEPGEPGEHGRLDANPAAGGGGTGASVGGFGGATEAPNGLAGDDSPPEGGGGGGAAGRIRVNTENGAAIVTGVVSPTESQGFLGRI